VNLQIDRLNLPISCNISNTLGLDDATFIHVSISLAYNLKIFFKSAINKKPERFLHLASEEASQPHCMGRNELWRTRRRESRAEKMNKHDVNEP
jgi:hypothetical protein